MHHFVIYIGRVEEDKMYLEGQIKLNHLLPPQIIQEGLHTASLMEMALHGLAATEGIKQRCDLLAMELVPPNPVVEAIQKMEGGS